MKLNVLELKYNSFIDTLIIELERICDGKTIRLDERFRLMYYPNMNNQSPEGVFSARFMTCLGGGHIRFVSDNNEALESGFCLDSLYVLLVDMVMGEEFKRVDDDGINELTEYIHTNESRERLTNG